MGTGWGRPCNYGHRAHPRCQEGGKRVDAGQMHTHAVDRVIPPRVCLCSPPGGEGRLDIGGCGCV